MVELNFKDPTLEAADRAIEKREASRGSRHEFERRLSAQAVL